MRSALLALSLSLPQLGAAHTPDSPALAPPAAGFEFIANEGQWPQAVRLAAPLVHGRLFLEDRGWTFALHQPVDPHEAGKTAAHEALRAHAVRMEFVGAGTPGRLQPLQPTAEVRNYLLGNDAERWAAGVKSYRELRYQQVWPGVDVRLYENRTQQLEYDFELAPQADAARIRQHFDGANALRLRPDGALEIQTSVGTITELAPQAWQLDAQGRQQPISCRYVLQGKEVSFQLGRYDHRRPLTIDPTVVFSTFTGSRADNWGFTATYDQQGNMYSGGIVFGLGYPTSIGAYNTNFSGNIDIALIKYNTATTGAASRVWATYLGGSGAEYPQSLVVNSQNELVLLGTTGSTNYPTTANAYDRSFNGGVAVNPYSSSVTDPLYGIPGGTDLVVTRLNVLGSALVASTFLGGSGNEGLIAATSAYAPLAHNYGDQFRGDILLDANDNVYVASNSASANFPVSSPFRPRNAGLEAVVCKLPAALNTLSWSSYLGGSGHDAAYSLQLDAAGRLFVCGGTASSDFPTTTGALRPSFGGMVDGFVARISASGTVLERASYLGTADYDQAYFVQLDTSGEPYILGQSLGSYPVTAGRYSNPGSRQFIHKLNADLTTTAFSTVFGSGRSTIDISPTAFLVDQCNRIFVSGWGGSNNTGPGNGTTFGLPLTAAAVQSVTDGNDFYLMQLSTGATQLEYATYFGGNGGDHVDGGTSRFDRRGLVYQAVCGGCGGSSSFPFPAGAGSYSTINGATNCNNAAFKFDFEPSRAVPGPDRTICQTAGPQPLTGSPAGGVWTGAGVTGSVATGYVFTPGTQPLGPTTLTYTVSTGQCQSQATVRLTVVAPPVVTFPVLAQTSFCPGSAPVSLAASPAGGTFFGPGVVGSTFNPATAGGGTHTLTYTYTQGGCSAQATQQVSVVAAAAGPGISLCTPAAPVALTGTPAGGTWTGQYVTGNASGGYFFAPPGAATGTVTLTYTVTAPSGCTSSSTRQAILTATPVVPAPAQTQFCVTSTTALTLPGSAIWSGPGVRGPSSAGFTFTPSLAGLGQHTLTFIAINGGCELRGSYVLSVGPPTQLALPADTILCPGSTQPFRLRGQPAGGTWSGPNVTAAGVFTPPAGFSGSVALTYTLSNSGCTATAVRRVSVAAVPATAPAWQPVTCAQDRDAPLRVRFTSQSSADLSWDFGDGSTAPGTTTEHVYTQPGRYTPQLTVRYNNGRCQQLIQLPPIDVAVPRIVPNVITPNGDNQNDVFQVPDGCPPRLQVFSRWGNKVYEAAEYRNDWGGGTQPAGTYYFLLSFVDGRTLKGWLEIMR